MPKAAPVSIAPDVVDPALLAAILREVLDLHRKVDLLATNLPVIPPDAAPAEELAALRRAVEALSMRTPANFPDSPDDAALLRAIVDYCGDKAFSCAALIAHARTAPALSAAVVAATGLLNAQSVGKRLKRIEGRDVGGLQVQRIGQDGAGVIWRIALWK